MKKLVGKELVGREAGGKEPVGKGVPWGFVVLAVVALAVVAFAALQFLAPSPQRSLGDYYAGVGVLPPLLLNHSGEGFSFAYPAGYSLEFDNSSAPVFVVSAGAPPYLEVISFSRADGFTDGDVVAVKNSFNSSEVKLFEKAVVGGVPVAFLNAVVEEEGMLLAYHRQAFFNCGSFTVVATGFVPPGLEGDLPLVDAAVRSVRCEAG